MRTSEGNESEGFAYDAVGGTGGVRRNSCGTAKRTRGEWSVMKNTPSYLRPRVRRDHCGGVTGEGTT